jgi:hypothetical protein
MSVLANVQRDFCQFILGHGHENIAKHIKMTDSSMESLLGIYRNNIFAAHHKSLQSDYPLVFSIIGKDIANKLVCEYVESSLPCTGALEDWGGGIIPFIQRFEDVAAWPYIAEIAQFEWAKHIAYCASEDPLLTTEDMRQLIDSDKKEINFNFQKSCQLLAFLHPLQEIISAHEQNQKFELSDGQGSSYALIVKHQGVIQVHWLTASIFVFINRLKEGQDIEVAFAAAQVLEPNFDAQDAFCFLLQQPILHR